MSVTNYMQYQTQAMAMERAAGLPQNFIDKETIGKLVGANVSTIELGARINDAVSLAYQSTPEQRQMFNQYFGSQYHFAGMGQQDAKVTTGQIAAVLLDPQRAEPLIHEQITAAQIGGTGVTAGLGAISRPLAMQLAQAGITQSQALSGFQQIGPLAPLEKDLVGLGKDKSQEAVNVNQLAESQFLGQSQATRAIQVAQEIRKAPFTGGGGFTTGARGSSVGAANQLGPTQPNS
jgi:hypothetical protein